MKVAKTIKLFVGGKFIRSESGRSFPVKFAKNDEHYANLCLGSRKDIREAVEVATTGLSDWSSRSAFNRSQILYRMAEMMEGKREEFIEVMSETMGLSDDNCNEEINSAIDAFVYYSGFCDKYVQLSSTINPINGPFGNYTSPEPVGVTAYISANKFDLTALISRISAVICGGNSVIVLLPKASECPAILSPLSEVFATSDLPNGVINLLNGDTDELLDIFASHMDIRSMVIDDEVNLPKARELSVGNLKRIVSKRKSAQSLENILDTVEYKTVWQPVGF